VKSNSFNRNIPTNPSKVSSIPNQCRLNLWINCVKMMIDVCPIQFNLTLSYLLDASLISRHLGDVYP